MIGIDNTELQKLYIAYFGRPGDPSGINYWLSQSISNESLTLKKISYELSLQEEYIQNILNDSSFESQINRFYINLFGRKSNFNGLNYLLNMINKQKYKISDIVYFLLYENRANEFFEFSQLEKDLFILDNKVFAAKIFTQQIHKSISLVNLYQPDSISPWSSGNSLIKASEFISNISSQKVTVQDVNNFIESLSGNSLTILTQPAIEMENISLSIPIYCLENRSLSKSITNKVTNLTGGISEVFKPRPINKIGTP